VREGRPLDELHDEVVAAILLVLADVVDDDRVGVGQLRRGGRLGTEPLGRRGIAGEVPVQQLDRHGAVEELVVGTPDHPGAARPDAVEQGVPVGEDASRRTRRDIVHGVVPSGVEVPDSSGVT
jgi:hypothetical protein